jgi:8-oxo-dGTP diphosphatase
MKETYPKLGVALYVLRDTDVLLIQRGKEPGLGKWALPGGGVNFGEDVITAALRELHEETGLHATSMDCDVVGISEFIQDGWHKFHVIVRVRHAYGQLRHGDDATDARFLPVNASREVLDYTRRMIAIVRKAP